ncbi:hypothetical protein [Paludisphaera soli]|uniref:hypothetical protein n=1 Tax=Paludisphaera soli TaxID=2712865 RepID=UPI0013EDE269|nr:hypothetical protein [Paludisphaera soli]
MTESIVAAPSGPSVSAPQDPAPTAPSHADPSTSPPAPPPSDPASAPRSDARDPSDPANWPDPIGFDAGLEAVPSFDYRLLPEPLRSRVRDVADRASAPAEYVAVPMLVALSGVIGRGLAVRPRRFDDFTPTANL